MKETGERLSVPPKVWNLAELDTRQLADISLLIGGSQNKLIDSADQPQFERYDTVIMNWGDERLEAVLEALTQQSGYRYGAENTQLVVLLGNHAIGMSIVPDIPFDPAAVTDSNGEVDGHLLALADPTFNPNNVFYGWNEEGAKYMQQYFLRTEEHCPWVRCDNYLLCFSYALTMESGSE